MLKPSPSLSLFISIVVSRPGFISHVIGSSGGSSGLIFGSNFVQLWNDFVGSEDSQNRFWFAGIDVSFWSGISHFAEQVLFFAGERPFMSLSNRKSGNVEGTVAKLCPNFVVSEDSCDGLTASGISKQVQFNSNLIWCFSSSSTSEVTEVKDNRKRGVTETQLT